jgi:hypothetical protein
MELLSLASDVWYVPVSSVCSSKWRKIGAVGALEACGGVDGDEEKARAVGNQK